MACLGLMAVFWGYQATATPAGQETVEARDRVRPEAEGLVDFTVCRAGGEPATRQIPAIDAARANLEAFAEAASGGAPYPIPPQDMVHNVAVLEAICASAESGAPAPVTRP